MTADYDIEGYEVEEIYGTEASSAEDKADAEAAAEEYASDIVAERDAAKGEALIIEEQIIVEVEKEKPEMVPIAAAPVVVEDQTDVVRLLNEGKKYYRDGDYDMAISSWNNVLESDPANKKALRYIERAEAKKAPQMISDEIAVEMPKAVSPGIMEIPGLMVAAPMTPEIKAEVITAPLAPQAKADYTMLTIKDCVTIALANHKPMRVALEEVLLAKMKVSQAKRGLFPSASLKEEEIEGSVPGGQNFRGREFAVELQQPIYQGGRLINTVRQSKISLAVSVKNYDKVKDDFTFEVEQAYFQMANAKANLKSHETMHVTAKGDLDAIVNQKKIGTARDVDVLNIQSQHDDVSFKERSAQHDLELAKMTLAHLLNIDSETVFDIAPVQRLTKSEYESFVINLDDCLKLAYNNRSDFYIKELMVQFYKYGVEISKSKGRLKVDLTGAYGLKREANYGTKLDMLKEYFIGLKASLPIGPHTLEESFINQDKAPSAGQTTSNRFESITTTLRLFDNFATMSVVQAQIAYHKALEAMYKAKKSIDFEVKKSYFDYQKAKLNLDGFLGKVRLGDEEVKIAKSQYDLNQAKLADVLRSKIRSNGHKTGFNRASMNYFISICKINKAVGVTGYFDPLSGKIEESLIDQNISRRKLVRSKNNISNYAAELSRAEKIVQSVKPDEKWWDIWEKDGTTQATLKDRWWETWEKDTKTGIVKPKNMWWMPWAKGKATAPRATQKKWWQVWKFDSVSHRSLSNSPFKSAADQKPFQPNAEDLVTRDMVKQLFQGGSR